MFCVDIRDKMYYNRTVKLRESVFLLFSRVSKAEYFFFPQRVNSMDLTDLNEKEKMRIVQELVPGKQITLAHVIANPDPILYRKLGLNPSVDYSKSAIGIVCMTPAESAIVTADIALKASGVEIGFVDRFCGTLILLGTVSEVSTSVEAVLRYAEETLKFTVCPLTKT